MLMKGLEKINEEKMICNEKLSLLFLVCLALFYCQTKKRSVATSKKILTETVLLIQDPLTC